MTNLIRYQANRFEHRYGDGSILQVIGWLNDGLTYKQIAKRLSEKHPISAPQLLKYMKQFSAVYHHPVEWMSNYYFAKEKEEQIEQIKFVTHKVQVLKEESNVIYHNFAPPAIAK